MTDPVQHLVSPQAVQNPAPVNMFHALDSMANVLQICTRHKLERSLTRCTGDTADAKRKRAAICISAYGCCKVCRDLYTRGMWLVCIDSAHMPADCFDEVLFHDFSVSQVVMGVVLIQVLYTAAVGAAGDAWFCVSSNQHQARQPACAFGRRQSHLHALLDARPVQQHKSHRQVIAVHRWTCIAIHDQCIHEDSVSGF